MLTTEDTYLDSFRNYWHYDVKPVINKCLEGVDVWYRYGNAEEPTLISKLEKELIAIGKKDWPTVQYICHMTEKVKESLEQKKNPKEHIVTMRNALISEGYYKDVFKKECKESRNYRNLGKLLDQAVKIAEKCGELEDARQV